jgi:hypothetical protein
MECLRQRLPLLIMTVLLLINLSGAASVATALPALEDERGCAETCCPGSSSSQDEPTGTCSKLECQCPTCVTIDLQRFSLTFHFSGEEIVAGGENSSLPPGEHPRRIDYPPEAA